jgi:hypothetical protein
MSPSSVGGAGGSFGQAQAVGQMTDEQYAKLDQEALGTPG